MKGETAQKAYRKVRAVGVGQSCVQMEQVLGFSIAIRCRAYLTIPSLFFSLLVHLHYN